jgi:hypothetical protein
MDAVVAGRAAKAAAAAGAADVQPLRPVAKRAPAHPKQRPLHWAAAATTRSIFAPPSPSPPR